ncbi:MAG: small multi-drug export protein [Actinomycetota bacterium]|nr:small multi-drug export protein [Actinomycetota bacterium]
MTKINILEAAVDLPAELIVFLFSALPIVELRGGIPLGIAIYKLEPWRVFLLACAGNLIPVVPLLLFLNPVSGWLAKRSRRFAALFDWLFEKTRKKHTDKMERYGAVGLFLFVGVPLPGTGAWTGALIAFLFDVHFKYAFPAILLGVLFAGIIMTAASTGAVLVANVIGGVFFAAILVFALGALIARRVVKKKRSL